MICARSCAGDCSLPSATRARDTRLPVRRSGNKRTLDDSEEEDERGMNNVEEDEIGVKDLKREDLEENLAPI
jgi:hypothetical protein